MATLGSISRDIRPQASPAPQRFKPAMFNGQSIGIPGSVQAPAINPNDSASISAAVANATNQANNANNQRYSQGLNVLTGGFNSALAGMDSYGTKEKQALKNQLAFNNGKSEQDAISRGLGNSTVRSGLLAQNQRTFNEGMTGVNENVARDRNALLTGGAGSIASFIANRNDNAPDLGMFAGLMQQAQANQMPQQQNTIRVQNGGLSGNSWQNPTMTPMPNQNVGPISQAIGGGQYFGPGYGAANFNSPLQQLAQQGVSMSDAPLLNKPIKPTITPR
jgi:hypothetical protein